MPPPRTLQEKIPMVSLIINKNTARILSIEHHLILLLLPKELQAIIPLQCKYYLYYICWTEPYRLSHHHHFILPLQTQTSHPTPLLPPCLNHKSQKIPRQNLQLRYFLPLSQQHRGYSCVQLNP